MSFTKMTGAVNNITQLPTRPNDAGYSAASLQALFDKAGGDLKTFINSLIDELEATTAAGNVGIDTIAYDGDTPAVADAATVQEGLAALYKAISTAVISGLSDDSVSTSTIQDDAVTSAKIADAAIITALLADLCVTTAKLAAKAVTTAKIDDAAVGTAQMADAAVTSAKLGAKSVTTAKIDDAAVDTTQIKDSAVTHAKTSGVQAQHKTTTVTVPSLTANTQTAVTGVSYVTETNTVIVSPAASSWQKWRDCGVRCVAQDDGELDFIAESATGQTLTANVLVLD